ncbi:MAG: hypothetical protein AB7O88_13500 [Reyranellaceae bacterium]
MLLSEAEAIMRQVRAHFAAGAKSGNKAYAASADVSLDPKGHKLDEVLSKLSPSASPIAKGADEVDDHTRRNQNVVIAMSQILKLRNDGEKDTAIAYGQRILDGGIRVGNCTEMACVAACLVSKKVGPEIDIAIVVTDGPGDHVFCVVGEASGWDSVRDVPENVASAIVIDPWANVCCTADEYERTFAAKMKVWLGQGKRIAAGGRDWLAPDKAYVDKIRYSSLDLRNARNSSAL